MTHTVTDDSPADVSDASDEQADTTHLDDVDDGCGCAEVWEHLSDERDE